MADKQTVVTLKTNRGDIVLRFFPDSAPEHVNNFVWHAEYTYPGCTFHRVIPGFMIQGGDPNTQPDGRGAPGTGGHGYKGPDTNLPAEFNERAHKRGIVSMARSQDPDSAGSQFFICHDDASFLDGQYTVFGEAVGGLDVVDAIAAADRDGNDMPHDDQRIETVLVEEWETERVDAMTLSTSPKEAD